MSQMLYLVHKMEESASYEQGPQYETERKVIKGDHDCSIFNNGI